MEKKKNKLKLWANLKANSWRLMVVLHWGVMFQIHMIEKMWWWGMITNELKSPNNLYLETKNQNMSRYEGYTYRVNLSYNIHYLSSSWN